MPAFDLIHFFVRRRASAAVRGRAALTAEQFAGLFESERERALAPAIRERLRRHIPVDVALVRPDDRLCEDLQLGAADGLDVTGMKIPDEDAAKMLTLRHMVSYLAAKVA